MASKLLIGLAIRLINRRRQNQIQAKASARVSRPTRPEAVRPRTTEYRLAGDPEPLDRIVVVRRGTLVLQFEAGRPALLRRPGRYLVPPQIPRRRPIQLVVVNTEPTTLLVRIPELVTL